MQNVRHAHIFRNGRNQAIRIPKEFELSGKEVFIHKEGSCLIIEPIPKKNNLSALLDSWKPSKVNFPEIKDLPPEDVDI
ncbi:MAG: AbrB/MazE/SpoVT family DNA-binding domain-containing protein [Gammaproteobacteria bacterium]